MRTLRITKRIFSIGKRNLFTNSKLLMPCRYDNDYSSFDYYGSSMPPAPILQTKAENEKLEKELVKLNQFIEKVNRQFEKVENQNKRSSD